MNPIAPAQPNLDDETDAIFARLRQEDAALRQMLHESAFLRHRLGLDVDAAEPILGGSPVVPILLDDDYDYSYDSHHGINLPDFPNQRHTERAQHDILRRVRDGRASRSNRYHRADRRHDYWEPVLTRGADIEGLRADEIRGLSRSPRSSPVSPRRAPANPYYIPAAPPPTQDRYSSSPYPGGFTPSVHPEFQPAEAAPEAPPPFLEPRQFYLPHPLIPQPIELDTEARIETIRHNIMRDYIYVGEFAGVEHVTNLDNAAGNCRYRVIQTLSGRPNLENNVFADAFVMNGKRAIFFNFR